MPPVILRATGRNPATNGSERSVNRKEHGGDNGLPPVLVIELVGLVQIPLFKEQAILPMNKKGPALLTEPIAQRIPDDAACGHQYKQDQQVQDIAARAPRYQAAHQFLAINARHE